MICFNPLNDQKEVISLHFKAFRRKNSFLSSKFFQFFAIFSLKILLIFLKYFLNFSKKEQRNRNFAVLLISYEGKLIMRLWQFLPPSSEQSSSA